MSYEIKLQEIKEKMGQRLQCDPDYVRDPRHPIIGSGSEQPKFTTPRWLPANEKINLYV